MNDLPNHCYENIFSYLQDSELRILQLVNKNFYNISKSVLRTFPIEELDKDNSPCNFIRDKVFGVSRHYRLRFEKRGNNDAEPVHIGKKRCIRGRDITGIRLNQMPLNLDYYDLSNLKRVEVNPFVFRCVNILGIEEILNSCKKIETLIIPRLHISEPILQAIEHMLELQDLQMADCKFPNGIPKMLLPLKLRNLECSIVRFESFHNITDLTMLKSLNMTDTCASVTDICSLSKLINLEHLNISWNCPGPILSAITQLTNLVSFSAVMSHVGLYDDVTCLRHLKKIEHLNLEYCSIMLDQIDWISNLTSLRRLYLGYNNVDYTGVLQICKCINIEILDLSYNSLDDRSGEVIGKTDWLKLKSLDLSGNLLTDSSVCMLCNMRVSSLDMSSNFLSDTCIEDMYTWSKIEDLKCHPQKSYLDTIPTFPIDFWQDM
jgi:Leucine-rich repeat (LRR) protein